jgi:integrase
MLSEEKLSQAIPLAKPYKIYDKEGLFALVQPTGAIWWRYRYRINGSENDISLGVYPAVGLEEARTRRKKAEQDIATGKSPSLSKVVVKRQRAAKESARFMAIAEEWFAMWGIGKAKKTTDKTLHILNAFVYPKIVPVYVKEDKQWIDTGQKTAFGDIDVRDIAPPQVFEVVKGVERQGKIDTAHTTKSRIAQILRYARPKGFETINVSDDLKGALQVQITTSHPALTAPKPVGELMRWIYSYSGRPLTREAFKLEAMLFPRPENLREMEWSEIDLANAVWDIPSEKMKGPIAKPKPGVIVPLPAQAVDILAGIKPLTSHCRYVFPNERGCVYPMSSNTLTIALKRGGYAGLHSWHGFRAMARTMIEERLEYDPKFPEMQLAHEVKDPNGRAYNRTAFLEQRIAMMQKWADYLDELRLSQ